MVTTRRPSARTRGWAARVEAHALQIPAALMREARANTRRVRTDDHFLWTLARELAVARGRELTLAYRSVVDVMPGYAIRCGARGPRVTGDLGIVFVVRRKRAVDAASRQHLPRWLLTFADRDGERLPFTLPTDVQDASDFHRAAAHAPGAVWTERPGWAPRPGHFAALVELRADAGRSVCMLGPQHVFTPFAEGRTLEIEAGLDVLPLDGGGVPQDRPRLSVSFPAGGVLRADERPDRPSFDVQLAQADPANLAQLRPRTPLRGISAATPAVRSMADVLALDRAGFFRLLTPDNHVSAPRRGPLRMTLATMPTRPLPIAYEFRDGRRAVVRAVYHDELLCFRGVGGDVPLRGDSGSPIVARRDDGRLTLVAMHIAGDEAGLSWAIPAWRLLSLEHWSQFPPGARLRLLEP